MSRRQKKQSKAERRREKLALRLQEEEEDSAVWDNLTRPAATTRRFYSAEAPPLTFAPLAWMKLKFLCHAAETEVCGFGRTRAENLLYIEDIFIPHQECSATYTDPDDDDLNRCLEDADRQGLRLEQVLRVWIHTHPHMSATPSHTDEDTFAEHLQNADWMVMAIYSKRQDFTARLGFKAGPGGALNLPLAIDDQRLGEQMERIAQLVPIWKEELRTRVRERAARVYSGPTYQHGSFAPYRWVPPTRTGWGGRPEEPDQRPAGNPYGGLCSPEAPSTSPLLTDPFAAPDLSWDQYQAALRSLGSPSTDLQDMVQRELTVEEQLLEEYERSYRAFGTPAGRPPQPDDWAEPEPAPPATPTQDEMR